ncbi:twin-arginine translocation signal domain-containing protein [Gemmatimonas sp.]|uniref:twin-arginine translocation signal domain-containing protein n=1 Tax=Gemmatimonas sp. TaxID=1962908 RepID=UPI00286D958A|nr:twin-arginine translocation signal domain-containing protein [Gemmatimonas sp.]
MFSGLTASTDRRGFLRRGSAAGGLALLAPHQAGAAGSSPSPFDALADASAERGPAAHTLAMAERRWDLSWVQPVRRAEDKAVIDTAGISDGFALQIAARYLDNCDAVYGRGKHQARVVLNIRTRAIPLAMSDALWARFNLGADYSVKDPLTGESATRNPFLARAANAPAYEVSIQDLQARGAIVLVCDFAMGHLATRLATKLGITADAVHTELLAGLISGATPMPSGMFGLAKAQNAGCAFIGTP